MKTTRKYFVLGLLYSTQTVPIAFMGTALPAIMRSEGVSLKAITYMSLVAIPSTIKFLWAPLVDRYGKKYFNWATVFTILYVLFFLPSVFLNVHQTLLLAILYTLAMACMSFQDIAMDAFAIKSLRTGQRAIGNGIQTGGNYLGLLIGSGALMLFYDQLGWKNAILILSAITLLPIFATIKYANESKKKQTRKDIAFKDFITYFKEKEFRKWIPVVSVLLIPANLSFSFSGLLLIDKGFALDQVGYLFGIGGACASIVSGFLSGILLKSASNRHKLMAALCSSIICVVCSLALFTVDGMQAYSHLPYILIMGLMVGTNTMVINDVSMSYVRNGKEGTDYSIQLFLRYLLYTPAIIWCGSVIEQFGYKTVFYGLLVIMMFIWVLVFKNFNFLTRRNKET
ncbi:MFS transporter [Arenibacter sp. M-2]|uniref:MFS transporter n=1 Tax=Arenibacter sp. M-2 TaxID=3053612 RepID=UPI002570C0E3|nr:MFS transporter [Arenibacter sp. M-2]MDL5511103.1 MFS transporter [Arenibacter sp. M-2]